MERILNDRQIDQFIKNGFIRIDHAFGRDLAEKARKILWNDIDGKPDDPTTWTKPVIRLGMYSQEPFVTAANTAVLHHVFDQLVGAGRWQPCRSMGTFPVRFPSLDEPGDTGWHVDASFPGAKPSDFLDWRINIRSKGRALLMLFLFSDVGADDAPTRIRVGSHLDVVNLLSPAGEDGLSFMELARKLTSLPPREVISATGEAGTVYLCHPFIVHGAQPHRGKEPRFLAQPPLLLKEELALGRSDGAHAPVEEAVRLGLKQIRTSS
jgi:hypothetical protein